jgi:hypothetical protein
MNLKHSLEIEHLSKVEIKEVEDSAVQCEILTHEEVESINEQLREAQNSCRAMHDHLES